MVKPDTSRKRLTEPVVRALRSWSAAYSIGDTVQRGLRVRVTPGAVSFVVVYSPRDGAPTRTFTIGRHPRVTLAAARNRAKEILAKVALGGDPQDDLIALRLKHRDGQDVNALAAAFIRQKEGDLAPKTLELYRWFERAIKDNRAGRMGVEEVTRADLERLLGDFAESGEVSANRMFQFIRAAFKWAVGRGRIATNPAAALERPYKEHSRDRVLSDDEVAALLTVLDEETNSQRAAAIRTLLLLGQRRGETVAMRWRDLDLKPRTGHATWTIPADFRKGGVLHVVPLPASVVEMLDALRAVTDGERVFPGVETQNVMRWWGPIRKRVIATLAETGYTAESFTIHDLRRTAMTGMTRLGVTRFVAQRVLGHVEGGVGGVYDRNGYLAEKADALNRWTAHVYRIADEERGKLLSFNSR